jgi:hypothetical protein
MQQECKIFKTIVFGMVHSQMHLVIFLQKHFTPKHSNAFNSITIITNCGAHSGTDCSDCVTSDVGSITEGVITIFH